MKTDLGSRFGRLVVVAKEGAGRRVCLCDCGEKKTVSASNLLNGSTNSCGCLNSELSSSRYKVLNLIHGKHLSREYAIWNSMKQRCECSSNSNYFRYGGRGITVCDSWKEDFRNFYRDMGDRPGKGYSIDRIDNNKGYCKENCRWATRKEQSNNTRATCKVTAFGRTLSREEWSRELGIDAYTIRDRLARGWTPELAVSAKPHSVPQAKRT